MWFVVLVLTHCDLTALITFSVILTLTCVTLPPPTGLEGDPEKMQELCDELISETEQLQEEEEQEQEEE